MKYINILIIFIILFIIIFLFDYLLIKKTYLKGKKKKNNELVELSYLLIKFNLDKNKLNIKRVLITISLINAFIMSMVSVILLLFKMNYILKLLVAFIMLLLVIYSIYEIYGNYLIKKGCSK